MPRRQTEFGELLSGFSGVGRREGDELLSQEVSRECKRATLQLLRLARARLADWLTHYADWIESEPAAASQSRSVTEAIIRGQIIHAEIQGREQEPRAVRFPVLGKGVPDGEIWRLTGIPDNWLSLRERGCG